MADDKGGGSSWGAFEIVLGIILLIGLLDRISTRIPGIVKDSSTRESVGYADASCGLSVTTPVSQQTIGRDVAIKGISGTCNWEPLGTIALFAQVVDAKGSPLSSYTPISVVGDMSALGKVEFSGTVAVTDISKTKTGYVFLVPAQQASEESVSVRIPIKF